MRVTVVGGGSWGTALANHLALKGLDVHMLVRDSAQAERIMTAHENPRYLPGVRLSPALRAGCDPARAFAGTRVCLVAVPCQSMRQKLLELAAFIPQGMACVCASKGIELGTLRSMRALTADVWPNHAARYAMLSGPSFAAELAAGQPTAVVLGCADQALGEWLQELFSSCVLRVYTSTDVTGVELGGALKNVMAIAAGVCDGLGLGHNARAGLITRGLAEMSRLGVAMGAAAATFMGLSGMGDLVLTCTGDLSRNRRVGLRLGQGETLAAIMADMNGVAEGVATAEAVCTLGRQLGVELPIARTVVQVVHGQGCAREAVHALMARSLRDE